MRSNGLYYESSRKRYRVRLYLKKQVIHESYHKTEADALKAFGEAIEYRKRKSEEPSFSVLLPVRLIDLLRSKSRKMSAK